MNERDTSSGEIFADDLTWREQEVLVLLAERLTNREVADRLHLAESTVKDYVGKILSKLYVANRRQAVERAKVLGLLDGDRESATRPPVRPPVNLPAEPTPFVGRRDELAQIKHCLAETRLLTLTGPGGIGKTRLALKAAGEATAGYEDGCFFVALAPIHSVEQLIQTIAEAIKFSIATHEDPQHQLLRYLRDRQLLLVMDNFEHLLDGAAIASAILQAAPAVKILATSRERLNLQSEMLMQVGGLAVPDQDTLQDSLDFDATALFAQRACKIIPGFDPSPDELIKITEICQIVQGMPLGIELAAAWLHILSVGEIAIELERGLDILATEMRDAPARHRSIRTVFDHSWSLLDNMERYIFMRLSVFRGGFTRQAAQQVAGASLGQLAGLVNKSFLSHVPDSGRLQVHELLRQYAHERLMAAPQARCSAQEAHAAYYADFMQQHWEDLKGSRQLPALAEIEADIQNVRAAWRTYLDQKNIPQIWRFIHCLWHVYWIRSWNHAGVELFAEAVRSLQGEVGDEATAVKALAMAYQAYFMGWLGLSEQGYELAQEGVNILLQLNYPKALAFAYDSLIVNAYFLNHYTEQVEITNKMMKLVNETDDKWLLALLLFAPAMVGLITENYTETKRIAEASLDLYEEIGDVILSTMPLILLGHVSLAQKEYERARSIYLRCLEISEQAGFIYSMQTSRKYLGKVTLSLGFITEAENYLVQCLRITKEVGFIRDVINLLYEFARLQAAQDNFEGAVELLALVLQHPASHQNRWLEGVVRDSAKDFLAEIEDKLPREAFTTALEHGRNLDLDELVAKLISPKRRNYLP
ncbi:LuxR C-terminal-related transcriptional regulator [Chloroflexota bacterium]